MCEAVHSPTRRHTSLLYASQCVKRINTCTRIPNVNVTFFFFFLLAFRFKSDYVEAVKGMKLHLMKESEPHKLLYFGELLGGRNFSPKMVRFKLVVWCDHCCVCFGKIFQLLFIFLSSKFSSYLFLLLSSFS